MFNVCISHGALKALALIAPDNEARTMLNTICVDTTTAGRVHLVACDGHRILCVNANTYAGDVVPGQFLIPAEFCRGVKQRGTERYPLAITITINPTMVDSRGDFAIEGKDTRTGQLMDAQYPQWHRVTPRKTSGKLAHYNLGYLGDFQRVAEYLGHDFPVIGYNGDDAALIDLGPDAFGVLMPIRRPKEARAFPDWFGAIEAKQEAA